jgi:hypothetical protein
MNTCEIADVLARIASELALGSPDPSIGTVALNRGDEGLLKSLDKVSAAAASSTHAGGASIAAHTAHLRDGFSILKRWMAGEVKPWTGADWTVSWRKNDVTDGEWATLRSDVRREATAWIDGMRTPRELDAIELGWLIGSIAHLGYHLGAIRQIDRDARGPTAEDERHAEEALRRKEMGHHS